MTDTRNPMQEAADELGCDYDELEATFPPNIIRFLREAQQIGDDE